MSGEKNKQSKGRPPRKNIRIREFELLGAYRRYANESGEDIDTQYQQALKASPPGKDSDVRHNVQEVREVRKLARRLAKMAVLRLEILAAWRRQTEKIAHHNEGTRLTAIKQALSQLVSITDKFKSFCEAHESKVPTEGLLSHEYWLNTRNKWDNVNTQGLEAACTELLTRTEVNRNAASSKDPQGTEGKGVKKKTRLKKADKVEKTPPTNGAFEVQETPVDFAACVAQSHARLQEQRFSRNY